MNSPEAPFRHITSSQNPALIESWCPGCGTFIAASENLRNLQAAEGSHACNGIPVPDHETEDLHRPVISRTNGHR